MHRVARWAVAAAAALVTMGSTCSNSDNRVTGTFDLIVQESRDTCETELNQFASSVTITTLAEGGYALDFGTQGHLTGDFNDSGVLVAQGITSVIVSGQSGPVEATMEVGLVIRQGQITDGSGRLTYVGTFPGVDGTCVQEFYLTGTRTSDRAPVVG